MLLRGSSSLGVASVLWVATCTLLVAQQRPPDLTGTIAFDVDSRSGRVERIAVQVGDGGTGRYKAVLAGDPSLPSHTIYRPRDLGPFGGSRLLPILVWGNGGCRNASGEFRNLLSDVASHGYVIVAIGPAGDSVVAGSEGPIYQSASTQLLDGLTWAIQENGRQGSEYYGKLDPSKAAVMGQSCGTRQALEVSGDPRVKTTVLFNGGGFFFTARGGTPAAPAAAASPAAGSPTGRGQAATAPAPAAAGRGGRSRYAPYAPVVQPAAPSSPASTSHLESLHAPVAFINGGPKDTAHAGALAAYDAIDNVLALHAWQDVGHYPATFRQPNGGAFAVAANAWLDWQLKGDQAASRLFVGAQCELCKDPKWHISIKNVPPR